MYISVITNDERTDTDRQQLRALGEAVYGPDDQPETSDDVTWDSTEISIIARHEAGGEIIAHAGVLARECLLDGQPVRVGGIGGVKTHPDVRGTGLGRTVMTEAQQLLRDRLDVDFGLLVCPEHVVPFYRRLGWQEFDGDLMVDQPAGRIRFTANRVMVYPGRQDVPRTGTLDLLGYPW